MPAAGSGGGPLGRGDGGSPHAPEPRRRGDPRGAQRAEPRGSRSSWPKMSNARIGDMQEKYKLCQSSWCCWTCTRPPDSLVPCAPCQPPCSSAGLRPLPAEAMTRNLPPGVRALELAHPLPALGKEDCADFFKCQTIRKKSWLEALTHYRKTPNTRTGIRGADVICANPTHLFGL